MTLAGSILVVDDDAAFAERLGRAFGKRGFNCRTCTSLAEARSALISSPISAAVVDLRLADGSGLELIPQLLALNGDTPILMLTGFGSIATALEAVRLGARDYVTKPTDPDSILVALGLAEEEDSERGSEKGHETPTLDRVEWEHIQRVLQEVGGNISRAARLLGINRRSLQRKLGKYPPPR